jgi:hypothetical protein
VKGPLAAVLASLATLALSMSAAAQGTPATYDHRAFGIAETRIENALRDADFPQLERTYAEFLQASARTRDGTWMMRAFQDAFDIVFDYTPPGKLEKLFRAWKEHDPRSVLRPIAEAFAWQARAWRAKGAGCYPSRPSSARKAFNALLDRSAAALREGEAASKRSPLWRTAAMRVAGGQGRPGADLDALLEEADRDLPGYEPLYAARLVFLLPEWGGDFGQVDAFVRRSVERTRAVEGRAFYAWLYLEVADQKTCDNLFGQSKVSWPEMRDAFEVMLARHPDTWTKNVFATFACRERDVDTTRRLLAELRGDANLGAASSSISNDACYRMIRPPDAPVTVSRKQPIWARPKA